MIEIQRPTLLLDVETCLNNISGMTARMSEFDVRFRPHFKSHQSRVIGHWFREEGIDAITVSSLAMAAYFQQDGWKDITVAFPVNLREAGLINALASEITLNLLVEDPEVIATLDSTLQHPVGVFLKIDVGTHRTGIDPKDIRTVDTCINVMAQSSWIHWKGFLAHAGHTYRVRRDVDAVDAIYQSSGALLHALKESYQSAFPGIIVSFGDTPGASMAGTFNYIDEMRPGNFVFYDLMQEEIGSCSRSDIAVALICPVVSCHPHRNEFVIYGGAVHASREFLNLNGTLVYGEVYPYVDGKWEITEKLGDLSALSQEHGVVRASQRAAREVTPGDLVAVLPVHSCLMAQAMGAYVDRHGNRYDHFARSEF